MIDGEKGEKAFKKKMDAVCWCVLHPSFFHVFPLTFLSFCMCLVVLIDWARKNWRMVKKNATRKNM